MMQFYSRNLSEYGMKYISLCYKRLYDGLLSKAYCMKPTDDQKPEEDEGSEEVGLVFLYDEDGTEDRGEQVEVDQVGDGLAHAVK